MTTTRRRSQLKPPRQASTDELRRCGAGASGRRCVLGQERGSDRLPGEPQSRELGARSPSSARTSSAAYSGPAAAMSSSGAGRAPMNSARSRAGSATRGRGAGRHRCRRVPARGRDRRGLGRRPSTIGRRSGSPSRPARSTMRRHCSTVNVSQNAVPIGKSMTDSVTAASAMPSTRPPRRTSQSRRRRLSSPAIRSTTSTIARCSPRSIRSNADPRAGLRGMRGRLERRSRLGLDRDRHGLAAARWNNRSIDGPRPRPVGATAGAARPGNQPPASAWIGIAGTRSGVTSGRSSQRRSPGPPGAGSAGLVRKASCDSVSDRRGTASRVTVT